jgi:hypothetical protein
VPTAMVSGLEREHGVGRRVWGCISEGDGHKGRQVARGADDARGCSQNHDALFAAEIKKYDVIGADVAANATAQEGVLRRIDTANKVTRAQQVVLEGRKPRAGRQEGHTRTGSCQGEGRDGLPSLMPLTALES